MPIYLGFTYSIMLHLISDRLLLGSWFLLLVLALGSCFLLEPCALLVPCTLYVVPYTVLQYGVGLTLVHPPSTIKLWPVICFALSDTRNNAAFAICSSEAAFPIGVIRDQVFSYSTSCTFLSVRVAPGAIA